MTNLKISSLYLVKYNECTPNALAGTDQIILQALDVLSAWTFPTHALSLPKGCTINYRTEFICST